MNTYEEGIGYGELELVSPYEIQTLQNLTFTQVVNEHARLAITGLIPAEKKDRCMQLARSTDQVVLYQKQNGQQLRPLFKGQVTEMAVRMVRGVYQINLEAVSSTCTMDYQRKCRSFQHHQMTYQAMVKEILADYVGADVIDTVSKATLLQQFILQYQETDWQFLQRMASHFRTVLVAAVDAEQPKFWFGLPEGRVEKLSATNYTLTKNRSLFLQRKHNDSEQPMEERDAVTYIVESRKSVRLGARVQFQQKPLVVAKSIARMKQGILTYTYHLQPEQGIRQDRRSIPFLPGTAIEGTVLDVKKDQVKVHLRIDETQKKEEATWFPLATPYSAEGHSGLYSPPEEGDHVHVAFPTHREEAAIVRQSIRKGGESNPKTADPNTSYWGTPKDKELKLDPQSVTVTAKEGAVFLQLQQDSGITVHSKPPLLVKANDTITFAGKKIALSATDSMRFTCGSSSMVFDGITDIQGQVVTMEGSIKAPVSIAASEEEADLEAALDMMGMIPAGGGDR